MTVGLVSVRGGAVPPPPLWYPTGLDATKTFFVDKNGDPSFALGEDGAELMPTLLQADIETYLSDRASRGVNLIWMQSLENILGSSPPKNASGDLPFTGGVDFVNPNSAYWNFIDYCMQRALVYRITVMFNPMFFGLSNSQGYRNSIMTSSDSVLQTFAGFLGARYSSFPNLIWLIGGDADPNNSTGYAKLNTFATALKAADTGHLMTMEASRFTEASVLAPNGGYSSVDAHTLAYGSVQSWLDVNWIYNTEATTLSGSKRGYPQGKPCLGGEFGYELEVSNGVTMTAALLRLQDYCSVIGGCSLGQLFGNGAIWSFNVGGIQASFPWKGQLSATGSLDLQRSGKLFRSRAFQKLVPDLNDTVMTVGSSSGSVCARTSDGVTIIAYIPTSQTITIAMSKITDSGSQANCNWYNPQTGAVTNIGTFANSSTRNFTSPDSNDWVLVIDSTAANLRTPGT